MGSRSKMVLTLIGAGLLITLCGANAIAQGYCAPPACQPQSGISWNMVSPPALPPPPPVPVPSFDGGNCGPKGCGPTAGYRGWNCAPQGRPPRTCAPPTCAPPTCAPPACAPPACGSSGMGGSWLGDLNTGLMDLFRGCSGPTCGW